MSKQTCGESEVKLHTFHFLRYKLIISPPITARYRTEIFHPRGFSVADSQGNDRRDTLYMASTNACHTATASLRTSPCDPERWTTLVNVAHLMGNRPGKPNLHNGLRSFATPKLPSLQTPTQTDLHPEHFLFQKVTPIGAEVW